MPMPSRVTLPAATYKAPVLSKPLRLKAYWPDKLEAAATAPMVIVAVALAPLVLSVLVAVIVTVAGVVGAVYTVVAPLAVWVGVKEPQFATAQVTVQSTPAF